MLRAVFGNKEAVKLLASTLDLVAGDPGVFLRPWLNSNGEQPRPNSSALLSEVFAKIPCPRRSAVHTHGVAVRRGGGAKTRKLFEPICLWRGSDARHTHAAKAPSPSPVFL